MKPLNGLQWLTVIMVVVMAITLPINFIQLSHSIGREGVLAKRASLAASQATQALCLLRGNYRDQYKATVKYLLDHPTGAPALGITAKALQNAAAKELAAANALNNVKCSH